MLLTASSASSFSSQPDPDIKEPVEDVEEEPNLEFQFALFQDDQSDLDFTLQQSLFQTLIYCSYLQSSAVAKMF